MKKKHTYKVNILPKKEKEMLKFMNDSNAMKKLLALGKLATSLERTKNEIKAQKFNTLTEWMIFSLNSMSDKLLEESKEFQKELELLVSKYELNKGDKDAKN